MIDRGKLGNFTLEFMDRIEESLKGQGKNPEEAELGAIMAIVEVQFPGDEDHEDGSTAVLVDCSDGRVWAQMGLLRAAQMATESNDE